MVDKPDKQEAHSFGSPVVPYRRSEPPPVPKQGSLWWLWVMAIIVLGAGGVYFVVQNQTMRGWLGIGVKPATPVARGVPVVTAFAEVKDFPIYVSGLGNVVPLNTVNIKPRVDGQIMAVYWKEGQLVHENDPLFDIDPRPYQAVLDQATAQLEKDQALLDGAKGDLKIYDEARASDPDNVAKQVYNDQVFLVKQYAANVDTDKANIEAAKVNVVYCHITAPVTGVMGLRQAGIADLGNIVHQTDTTDLALITTLQPITIIFTLPQDVVGQVVRKWRSGEQVKVLAYDGSDRKALASGYVLAVGNQVDVNSGTFPVRAQFDNADNKLYPSQLVTARLLIDTLEHVVVVPSETVQVSPSDKFVYVVNPADMTVKSVSVTPDPRPQKGDYTAIIGGGLKGGEMLVRNGVDKLQSGTKVSLPATQPAATQPSATQKAGGSAKSPHSS